jgi:hypothetical protein
MNGTFADEVCMSALLLRRPRSFALALACLALLGCHSLKLAPLSTDRPAKPDRDPAVAAPGKFSMRLSQYVFLSDFELKRDLPLFQDLSELRDQVYRELELPTASSLVQVFLFEDRDRYERFMHARYPDLPKRRAFFVAQPRSVGGGEDLYVYTYWGDRVREDLRHELTHALLHSVLKDVPLWLDEGLAEYFELPPETKGVNVRHLEQLRRGPFQPELARLEQLGQVQQMTPVEYREAWAWVHLMLRDRPEAKVVLLHYLAQLRTNPTPGPVGPQLAKVYPVPEDALQQHLGRLDPPGPAIIPTAQR